ncbi:MAG TPA: GNAT family N-acetyltransferase [Polyangia bacterium]|nr:GNAT family N-acetyltransferase [Polyangia bacterium]
MTVRAHLLGREDLCALEPDWRALARAVGTGDPALAPAWTQALADALPAGCEICVGVVREGRDLLAVAPLVRTEVRLARAWPTQVLSPPGALLWGPAAPASSVLLSARGAEVRAAAALLERLFDARWDLFDLATVDEAAPARVLLPSVCTRLGRVSQIATAASVPCARLAGSYEDYAQALALVGRPAVRRGLRELDAQLCEGAGAVPELLSLLRRQASARGRPPFGAAGAAGLRALMRRFGEEGAVRIGVAARAGRTVAGLLALATGDTLTVLARPVDPEAAHTEVADALVATYLRGALADGATALRLPPGDSPCERFATGTRRVFHLRLYGRTVAGRVMGRSAAVAARAAPRARAALERLRGRAGTGSLGPPVPASWAGARKLAWTRLSLYRGELPDSQTLPWQTGDGLELAPMTLAQFEGLEPTRRQLLCRTLELQEAYCRHKWARGDRVLRADLDGQPAGILWCALGAVYVPELDREVRPGPSACYVHDVFVAPWARGRAVAPALLARLHDQMRATDVHLMWALVRRDNRASARAFEKAAFVPVCEVLYARVGGASHLYTRPAHPDAHKLLGL